MWEKRVTNSNFDPNTGLSLLKTSREKVKLCKFSWHANHGGERS